MDSLSLALDIISYIIMPLRQLLYGFIVGTGHTKFVLFSAIISSIGEVTTIMLLKMAIWKTW